MATGSKFQGDFVLLLGAFLNALNYLSILPDVGNVAWQGLDCLKGPRPALQPNVLGQQPDNLRVSLISASCYPCLDFTALSIYVCRWVFSFLFLKSLETPNNDHDEWTSMSWLEVMVLTINTANFRSRLRSGRYACACARGHGTKDLQRLKARSEASRI